MLIEVEVQPKCCDAQKWDGNKGGYINWNYWQ